MDNGRKGTTYLDVGGKIVWEKWVVVKIGKET